MIYAVRLPNGQTMHVEAYSEDHARRKVARQFRDRDQEALEDMASSQAAERGQEIGSALVRVFAVRAEVVLDDQVALAKIFARYHNMDGSLDQGMEFIQGFVRGLKQEPSAVQESISTKLDEILDMMDQRREKRKMIAAPKG